jgi:hypothetical protein
MNRPLLISDCDEVLLHFASPFRGWLDEHHAIDLRLGSGAGFVDSIFRKASDEAVPVDELWPLLDDFFTGEMDRQPAVPGAVDAIARIAEVADVVILTNLQDHHQQRRLAQLSGHGIPHRVICNQGPKGPRVAALVKEMAPSAAVFVDDLPPHHRSVAECAPEVARLHMVAEPLLQQVLHPAPAADARIDRWDEALPWILNRLAGSGRAG